IPEVEDVTENADEIPEVEEAYEIADDTFDDEKIDLMGFYNGNVEPAYDEPVYEEPVYEEPVSDSIGDTQVFVPLDEQAQYLEDDGYVDAPEYSDDDYDYAPVRTKKKKKRGGALKTIGLVVAMLVVVAGLSAMISSVAFRVMGLSDNNSTSSAPLYNYSSSNDSLDEFNNSSDSASSDEFELIGFGDSGYKVMSIQTRLCELGYLDYDKISSVFDADTQVAIREFQSVNRLNDSGAVDEETFELLFSENAAKATTTATTVTTTVNTTTTTTVTTTTESTTSTTEATTASSSDNSSTTSSSTKKTTTKKTTTTTAPDTSSDVPSDVSSDVSSSEDASSKTPLENWLEFWQ
ncbi:MAG: peptidoglycan-binding protein, partial [Acutalibacteraceae bacterium]